MVFAVYYILGGLAQTWVEQGTIGSLPGVWWLYVLMLITALGLLSSSLEQRMLLRR
jgi:lipopolysaccharide export system permease protein